MNKLLFTKLHPQSQQPTKAYKNDAGWDLYSVEEKIIKPGELVEVDVGIATAIPEGYFGCIATRSSYGKKGLRCHFGIIDCSYRGRYSIWIQNHGNEDFEIRVGDKVAQLIILPVVGVEFEECLALPSSERGLKGHGSSGR